MNLVVYGPRTGRAMEVVERMRAGKMILAFVDVCCWYLGGKEGR